MVITGSVIGGSAERSWIVWGPEPMLKAIVSAVSRSEVLGYSTDFYESFLTWTNGLITLSLDEVREITPAIEGISVTRLDAHSVDVEMPRSMDLNRVFAAFDAAGMRVRSMRNKTNRLEELFVRLTTQEGAA